MATSILSIYLRINEVDPNAKIQKKNENNQVIETDK